MGEKKKILCVNKIVKDTIVIRKNITELYGIEIVNASIYDYSEYLDKANVYDAIIINTNVMDKEVSELVNKFKNKVNLPIILYCKRNVVHVEKTIMKMNIDDCIFHDTTDEEFCFRILFNVNKKENKCIRQIKLGDRIINLNDGIVEKENDICKLTPKEVSIIQKLYENKNHVVSMDEISNILWQTDSYGYENAIMVHIGRIRKKVEKDPAHPRYITTIKGLGYSFCSSFNAFDR